MAEENLELEDLNSENEAESGEASKEEKLAPETDSEPDFIEGAPRSSRDLEAVYDIPVKVSAVLGKSSMQVHELLKLGRGAIIELDRKVGEAVDIYVNNRLVARGEVVVVEDKLGITMTEIIKTEKAT